MQLNNIMKAKDYFKKFNEENQDKSVDWRLINSFREMVLEINEIAKMRNVKTDSGLIPIFKEQHLKCNSFCRMLNEIEPYKSEGSIKQDAFKIYMECESPDLAKLVW